MACTVILRHDGIVRNYGCETYFDGIVLYDALERRYGAQCTELWVADRRDR